METLENLELLITHSLKVLLEIYKKILATQKHEQNFQVRSRQTSRTDLCEDELLHKHTYNYIFQMSSIHKTSILSPPN